MIAIVTPCTRVGNLPEIYESIRRLSDPFIWVISMDKRVVSDDVTWEPDAAPDWPSKIVQLRSFNSDSRFGNSQRNLAVRHLKDELEYRDMIYYLDDDTLLHPNFQELLSWRRQNSHAKVVAFSQEMRAEFGYVRRLDIKSIEQFSVNNIDTGCAIFHIDVAYAHPWRLYEYEADGYFYEEIREHHPMDIAIIPGCYSYYNELVK